MGLLGGFVVLLEHDKSQNAAEYYAQNTERCHNSHDPIPLPPGPRLGEIMNPFHLPISTVPNSRCLLRRTRLQVRLPNFRSRGIAIRMRFQRRVRSLRPVSSPRLRRHLQRRVLYMFQTNIIRRAHSPPSHLARHLYPLDLPKTNAPYNLFQI